MKKLKLLFIPFVLLFSMTFLNQCSKNKEKTKVLIITGGHDFEKQAFYDVFRSFSNIDFDTIFQPEANNVYASDSIDKYDVLVFYDMVQEITEQQKNDFIKMLNKGKGILFLHHSLASYQKWSDFGEIIGGRYLLQPIEKDGVIFMPASDYKHDQEIPVKVVDREHPVTRGITDFTIHDETYGNIVTTGSIHPLMRTDHPLNGKNIAWANEWGNSKIIYLQLGHDHFAFGNPNFRKIVDQSIVWLAGKQDFTN